MSPLDVVLAALPLCAVVIMLALRVPSLVAVLSGLALIAALSFRFPIPGDEFLAASRSLGGVTLAVAVIMLSGLVLSALLTVSGAQDRISE